MTQNFTVFKTKENLAEQWAFFGKRASGNHIKLLQKSFFAIAIFSVLYSLFLFFSGVDKYITLKAISSVILAMAWLVLLILLPITYIKVNRVKAFVVDYVASVLPEQLNYKVEISETSLKIISGPIEQEYVWDNFTAYIIENDTVYVFNSTNPMDSLYWSKEEIGDSNFSFLIETLQQKSIKRSF